MNNNILSETVVLSIDIDGTIANIQKRIEYANYWYYKDTPEYWDTLLDGKNYGMDKPIKSALQFLQDFA